jgi:peptidoglycan hydrolase-like protein with peptidoglycan-binding domain
MDPKLLTEAGWKAIAAKFKIKDNGLQKVLAAYEKIDDKEHDDRLKVMASVSQLAGLLKKAKDVAAAPAAVKYVTEVASAAEAEQRQITKDKALAEKAQAVAAKAEAAAKKQGQGEDEEEEEQGEFFDVLTRTIKSLKTAKQPYFFQVCDAKPYGLIISKKDIRKSAQHRKQLSQIAGGSTRPPKFGECRIEGGNKLVLEMEKPPSGLARVIQKWIKDSISLVLKVQVGTESSDDEEQSPDAAAAQGGARTTVTPGTDDQGEEVLNIGGAPGAEEKGKKGADKPKQQAAGAAAAAPGADTPAAEPALDPKAPFKISSSVGQGAKNKPADVQAVQVALNLQAKAGLKVDGKIGPKTIAAIKAFQQTMGQFKPDGVIEVGRGTARALSGAVKLGPPPAPPKPVPVPTLGKGTLDKAPDAWHNTRNIVQTNIGELKKAVRSHYSAENPALLKDIEKNLKKLDGILDKLDTKLAESLANAKTAKNDAERKNHLKNSKVILTNYITYVKSEPLIDHIDKNPWGVQTNIKKSLSATMMHIAQAIGT